MPFEGIIKSYDSANLLRGYVDVTTEYENLAFMNSRTPYNANSYFPIMMVLITTQWSLVVLVLLF